MAVKTPERTARLLLGIERTREALLAGEPVPIETDEKREGKRNYWALPRGNGVWLLIREHHDANGPVMYRITANAGDSATWHCTHNADLGIPRRTAYGCRHAKILHAMLSACGIEA